MKRISKPGSKTNTELLRLKKEYSTLQKAFRKAVSDFTLSQSKLKESEEIYRLLFEYSGEAILFTNPDGEIYAANPSACRIYNMSEEEICRAGWDQLLDKNDPRVAEELKIRKKKGIFRGEINQVRKDGIVFPSELSSIVFKDSKNQQRTCTIIRDISGHKYKEKLLSLHSIILEKISEGICLVKSDNETIVFTNSKFDKMFGYNQGELIGKNVSVLIAPSEVSPEEKKGRILKILSSKGEWKGELLNLRKNGETFWCFASASLFDHPDFGKVFLSIHTDIGELKRTEASLKESENWLNTILNSMADALLVITPDGIIMKTNEAADNILGYKEDELKDHSTRLLYASRRQFDEVGKRIKEAFQKIKNARFEFKTRKKDGTIFPSEHSVSALYDADMRMTGIVHIVRDITERKKAELLLHNASLYARNLIESSLDPFVTISTEGKITDVNLATEKITGVKRSKLIGNDFVSYFTEPDKAREGYKMVFSEGQVRDFPLTMKNINGLTVDVLFNATLYKNSFGEVEGVFAAARDITEIKKMEKRLRESKVQLELLNQHLVDIRENERAKISREIHDQLGQSLTILKLEMNQLAESVRGNKELTGKVKNILELVNSTLLSTRQLSADLRPLILDDLGLISTLEWYCKDFQKRSRIKCSFDTDGSTYEDQNINLTIFRVLQEALTNVLRHSHATEVNVILHKSKEGISFSVWDNGVGIRKSNINSIKSLGLAGMNERVRQIGGTFTISRVNGTKISVFIPEKS